MASLAGKVPPVYLASYAATKHGVVGFTHALRAEHGRRAGRLLGDLPRLRQQGGHVRAARAPIEAADLASWEPCRRSRVGDAVVRAIRKNPAEVIVNKGPVRPLICAQRRGASLASRIGRTRPCASSPSGSRGPGIACSRRAVGQRRAIGSDLQRAGARAASRLPLLLQSGDRRKEVVLT